MRFLSIHVDMLTGNLAAAQKHSWYGHSGVALQEQRSNGIAHTSSASGIAALYQPLVENVLC